MQILRRARHEKKHLREKHATGLIWRAAIFRERGGKTRGGAAGCSVPSLEHDFPTRRLDGTPQKLLPLELIGTVKTNRVGRWPFRPRFTKRLRQLGNQQPHKLLVPLFCIEGYPFDLLSLCITVVEQLIRRDFERLRILLKRVERRHCVFILDARCITTQQARALFDVSLRKVP